MTKQKTTRRTGLLIAALIGFGMGSAYAQSSADVAAVMEANNAFYSALGALDAAAMDGVWAHEPYVTNISPANKAVTTGWVAVQDGWKSFMTAAMQKFQGTGIAKPVDTQVHINGNVAWTVGKETVDRKLNDGTQFTGTNFVSNVFEKKDGRWLMVSHHAHIVPQ
jgi:ketosteroid isomerase-like protein